MSRDFSRASRIADQIQRDLSDLIRLEVKDPRVGLVTITAVEVTRDLSHAKVYVTSLAAGPQTGADQAALQHAAGFLRSQLARTPQASHASRSFSSSTMPRSSGESACLS